MAAGRLPACGRSDYAQPSSGPQAFSPPADRSWISASRSG